jgi:hypothetical protein
MQPITVTIPANSAAGATSQWVRFDHWSIGDVGLQVVVNGTVNYTLQTTFDDPNDPVSPVPANSVTWFDSTDTDVKNSTKNAVSQLVPTPVYARILLNSGNGSLRATFIQTGSATF